MRSNECILKQTFKEQWVLLTFPEGLSVGYLSKSKDLRVQLPHNPTLIKAIKANKNMRSSCWLEKLNIYSVPIQTSLWISQFV